MENDEVRFLNNLIAQFNGAPVSLLDLAADSDNQWEDGTVVDVHAGLAARGRSLFAEPACSGSLAMSD